MRRSGAVTLLAMAVLAGCAPSVTYLSKTYSAPHRIAVLPMANDTNDLDGPPQIRRLLEQMLRAKGFEVVPPEEVDVALKAQGFTDGGQLHATTPQKLAEWTGAEAVLYSTLDEFNYINVGFYWERKVGVTGRLVNASGERLWESTRSWSTKGIVTNKEEAKRVFAIQMAAKAIEKMSHRPLQFESVRTVEILLTTLPAY